MFANERDEDLSEKRIALIGLGVENRSVGRYLAARGIEFSVCDARSPGELRETQEWGHVADWHLGGGYLDRVEEFDVLFRTPGISARHPDLVRAQRSGVSLHSQTRLFFERCPAPIVAVTGTKGKGTTCSLLFELLRDGPYEQVWLGGNIGTPAVDFLDDVTPPHLVILELSSFQLQDLDRSPQVAVVLSVTSDHLDYHADREEYVAAKRSICRYQSADDIVIVDGNCDTATSFADDTAARAMRFRLDGEVEAGAFAEDGQLWARPLSGRGGIPAGGRICAAADLKLRGRHNTANALAAAAAALAVGVRVDRLAPSLVSFRGLEHRLEHVDTADGVEYYNDSLATTPDATLAALRSFTSPVILIAGGSSKGADFAELAGGIARSEVKALVMLASAEELRLANAARAAGYAGHVVHGCAGMPEALKAARQWSTAGDVILLSPACASFGMFASYAERGLAFKSAVAAVNRDGRA